MEPPSKHSIAVLNNSGRRAPRALIARAISAALDLHKAPSSEVSVLLCEDDEIRALNSRFRQVDEPTDVLTFPSSGAKGEPLGDIAISVPYAERQAIARGVSLNQEIGYLAIHGALHLLGLDDDTEVERAEMVREMNRAAVAAGLAPDDNWASILHKEKAS